MVASARANGFHKCEDRRWPKRCAQPWRLWTPEGGAPVGLVTAEPRELDSDAHSLPYEVPEGSHWRAIECGTYRVLYTAELLGAVGGSESGAALAPSGGACSLVLHQGPFGSEEETEIALGAPVLSLKAWDARQCGATVIQAGLGCGIGDTEAEAWEDAMAQAEELLLAL